MQTQSTTRPCEIRPFSVDPGDQNHWIEFNRELTLDAASLPNEASIEGRLEALMEMDIDDLRIFWLTLSRIAELAVKQAGDCVDNCEFEAAGDLLVNPRRIDVYRRGKTTPIVKDRHCGLSDQFAAAIGNDDPVAWLSRETHPCVRKEALLPHLKKMLSWSGFMTTEYLVDLDRRMCQVADTIAFLTSWQIADSSQLFERMAAAGSGDEAFILSNLCRFDLNRFSAMGADIQNLVINTRCSDHFLRSVH